ncbi:hypothetical protein B9Z55_004988 [Caenorhabditis nigoni]|uniref:Uncharacterized protein n=1 Tax=Caenorhabditis nigoni TaxID=1611254 RepID=A0A2G5UZN3_9PELO|nr:hypothetical protein B9Z55_004988 [Caenorhabditis nigoni]
MNGFWFLIFAGYSNVKESKECIEVEVTVTDSFKQNSIPTKLTLLEVINRFKMPEKIQEQDKAVPDGSISKPGVYGKNDRNFPKNQLRGYHHRHVLYGGICHHQRLAPIYLHLYAQFPRKGESFILNVHSKWHNPLGQVALMDWYRRLFDQMLKNGEIENVQVFEDLELEKFPHRKLQPWSTTLNANLLASRKKFLKITLDPFDDTPHCSYISGNCKM